MSSRREFLSFTMRNALLLTTTRQLLPLADAFSGIPSASNLALRFGVVSDGHYGQEQTDYQMKHDLVIGALNREKHNRRLDFSFVNGDLFHNDPKQLLPVKKAWSALQMPWFVSHGNHDQVSEFEWENAFGRAWNYGFEKSGCGFVVLNTASNEGEYTCPDPSTTRALLREYAHQENLFVFMHITPRKWTRAGIDCPQIVELFNEQKNLRAVFHGHDHDVEGGMMKDGISYLFDAHVAGNWGLPYTGYRIVEIMKDGNILTYQMNADTGKEVNRFGLS